MDNREFQPIQLKDLTFKEKMSETFFKPREISLADFALVILILGIIDITTFTIKTVLTLVFN